MAQVQEVPAPGQEGHGDFRKILVGFDGSDHSIRALQVACEMAKRFLSELVVVTVYLSSAHTIAGPDIPIPRIESFESQLEKEAKEKVERAVSIAKNEGVEAKGVTLGASSAVQAIAEYALENQADLIVLGTRGLTGFRRLTMGSVSSGVVSHAHCPVLVVR
jgi:nucleotide-binding universal stress UspA family protein